TSRAASPATSASTRSDSRPPRNSSYTTARRGQALPPRHASGGRLAGLRAPRPVHREGDRRGPGDGPDVDPRRERPGPEPAQRGDGPRQPGLLGGVPRPVGGDRPQGHNEQQVQRRRRRRGVRPGGLRVGSPGAVPVRRGWTGEDAARGDQAREAVDGGGRGVRGAGVREQGGRGGRNAHVLQAAALAKFTQCHFSTQSPSY
ncbi:hypothetical protein THAOC_00146, partial [Thalassiosira oceanica]